MSGDEGMTNTPSYSTPHVTSTTPYGVTINTQLGDGRYKKKVIKYKCPYCGKAIRITIEEDDV